MRLVLMILFIPIILFVVALTVLWLPLPAPFPPASSMGWEALAAEPSLVQGVGRGSAPVVQRSLVPGQVCGRCRFLLRTILYY